MGRAASSTLVGRSAVLTMLCVCVCVCVCVCINMTGTFLFLAPGTNQLTHLFSMSPSQRDLAADCYQVLTHDHTYKTNRFKLPCGLFSAPNR